MKKSILKMLRFFFFAPDCIFNKNAVFMAIHVSCSTKFVDNSSFTTLVLYMYSVANDDLSKY